tara:strand:+ start:55 stop:1215 length:1161 start_codon:yes stop_codon:yes gene_type:complete
MAELRQNTWTLDQWYDQDVAGNVSYSGSSSMFVAGWDQAAGLAQNVSTNLKYSSPVQIPGTTWKQIRFPRQYDNAGGMKSDGSIWSWGNGDDGSAGTNDDVTYSSPIQILAGSGSVGGYSLDARNGIAQKSDGTIWSWGKGSEGANGQNNRTSYSSPMQIGTGEDWSKVVSAGYRHMGAVKTDGTLWVWGKNSDGILGLNQADGARVSSPTQIPGTWSTSEGGYGGGYYFSLGIKNDGTLWAWGSNTNGRLGQNDETKQSSPVQIPGDTWSYVAATQEAAHAVKTDGTLWVWGNNTNGQLGLNNRTKYSSPVQVGSGTDWSKVWNSENSAAALKTDGTLWAMGNNESGQFMNNSTAVEKYSSPTQIPGTYQWASFSNYRSGAIQEL